MRTNTIILLTALLTLTSPTPLPSSLIPRTPQYCANAPTIPAGSLLPRALTSTFPPRAPTPPTTSVRFAGPYLWCAPGSRTYIITTISRLIPGPSVRDTLVGVYNAILTHIHQTGDAPIPHGAFVDNNPVSQISLEIANVDNHQTTWGVFGAALTALEDCMGFYGVWGEANFHVYDGGNLVGAGTLGLFDSVGVGDSVLGAPGV